MKKPSKKQEKPLCKRGKLLTLHRYAIKNAMKYKITLIICCLMAAFMAANAQSEIITLRVMTYNIRHGAGMDDVVDLDRQAKIIQDAGPDIVGLQEVDSIVPRSGKVDETAYLAQRLGMYGSYGPAIPLSGGKYGVAILSKERPLSVRNIPLPGKEPRTLLVCEFQDYVFATTHLDLEEENRLASLPIITEEASRHEKPFFICGDWNDEPDSKLITTMKKKNFVFMNNITDTSTSYTFPAGKPTITIDYIASLGRVFRSVRNKKVINEPVASDHRPVYLEVRFDQPTDIRPVSANGVNLPTEDIYDLSGKKITNQKLSPGVYIQKKKDEKRKFVSKD